MRGKHAETIDRRLSTVERLIDKVDRSVERIEIVTVVREPNSNVAADAYNGLRKQVIAAVGERNAHLQQLAQFDSALRAGATPEELQTLVGEWMAQASIELVDDTRIEDAFEVVGTNGDGEGDLAVIRSAYVDALTGRVVRRGVAERTIRPAGAPGDAGDAGEEQDTEQGA